MSTLSRRRLLTGAAAAAATAAVLPFVATTARGAEGKTPKVLLIGIDGTLLGRIKDADAPALKGLMAAGLTAPSSMPADSPAPTLSGPGWSTLLTGVWPAKHRVLNNDITGHQLKKYPDFLTRIEKTKPALGTLAVCSWNPIPNKIIARADTEIPTPEAEYDEGTTKSAVDKLSTTNPDAVFVHLDNVDHAGHDSGAASQAYLDAIHGVDGQIGRILDAVKSRATYGEEDWLILITTDHGHTDGGGHGGTSAPERETFLIASGGGIAAGSTRDDVRMPDVAVIALTHLGIPVDAAWDLDGKPLA
ncbi:alkaline phosphatase family protein [Streptomyces sp. NA04227]|uniref:alkaline phosphatase family protein n=1 Tax=Streptomyces sp. NA04227 TaxID=2742136 RepID=UPI0020CA5FB7|nr:alkaline phosphatase family protein [Streptomyces sp. NA04227]